jgi:hypothetical protein
LNPRSRHAWQAWPARLEVTTSLLTKCDIILATLHLGIGSGSQEEERLVEKAQSDKKERKVRDRTESVRVRD